MAARNMNDRIPAVAPSRFDRAIRGLHRWVWREPHRRGRKLLSFAATEADGGRDLARAAELTGDGLLRRLYLRHALDEQRHARLFEQRARAILRGLPPSDSTVEANWMAPGERGLDDLDVRKEKDASLLAFLHLSEKAAAGRFALYRQVLAHDPDTREVFGHILRDETFHMNYTRSQLVRVARGRPRKHIWRARLRRLWRGYLRLATALAGLLGTILLLLQYFVILPLFALLARRAARQERPGWVVVEARGGADARRRLETQY
jgi:rubrerythrin